MDNHFTIFIPTYNCEQWVDKNLLSVVTQQYQNYDVLYIDDNSTDKTCEKALTYQRKNVKIIKNSFNKGKMSNMYEYVTPLRDDTIVVILDGDDWLHDENVLSKLNEVYTEDVWMTNGSYIVNTTKEIVRPQHHPGYWDSNIRTKSWQFSHLGTFRKKLFSKIKRKHLMNKQGSWWATTSDQAIMWPMAEMAGPEHHRVIDDVLYVYNRLNPLSDDRRFRDDQLLTEKIIRSIEPYARLENL